MTRNSLLSHNASLQTASLGFPRMGRNRELKFALESDWRGQTTEADMLSVAKKLRRDYWLLQQTAGVSIIPSNDFSLYDQVLDALVLIGATPERFGNQSVTLTQYFVIVRNSNEQTTMEMTKWFDTNYHYRVREWTDGLSSIPDTTKLFGEIREARALGFETRPVLIGPITLLLLGKSVAGYDITLLLPKLVAAYKQVLHTLCAEGITDVQIDEPKRVTDLTPWEKQAYRSAYKQLGEVPVRLILRRLGGQSEPCSRSSRSRRAH